MKKFTIFLVSLFAVLSILPASAGDDHIIPVGELPSPARQLLETYFKEVGVSYAKVDEDWFDREYKVVFVNGMKIEFLKDGSWKEIDCRYNGEVPADLIPKEIVDYLGQTFLEWRTVGIEQDRRGYEVRLDNGLDLKFDRRFRLVGTDD